MEQTEMELAHIATLRSIAPECMVLLKSDGSFPLGETGKIALYGSGARKTIKGGTGSGDVNVRHYVTVEEGLENAGFTVTTKAWLDAYEEVYKAAHARFASQMKETIAKEGFSALLKAMGAIMPEPDYALPLNGEGDTAIYVLSRISGEGTDREVRPGDFLLTQTEIRDILQLQRQYKKFLLVLNVGGVVDLTPIAGQVENILLLSQTGMTIGDSFADVLLGKAYPSGRLASTWASWADYCHVGDFAEQDDTHYREGIYVGYRYFDTVGKAPLFPFGYGLGYTTFSWVAETVQIEGSKVSVTANVKNVGNRPGKEVMQLYVSIPDGKLDQPYQVLAAFDKTEELAPGGEASVPLTFDMRSLASFDEESANSILEAGDYILRLGNSSRSTEPVAIVHTDKTHLIQRLSHSGGDCGFEDWRPPRPIKAAVDTVPVLHLNTVCEIVPEPIPEDPAAQQIAKGMTSEELTYLCVGGFRDEGSQSVIGNAGIQVAGAAGETTGMFMDRGIPAMVMADGPAGLRISLEYGMDENGVYSMDAGAMESMLELLPDEMVSMLREKFKAGSKRTGTVHYQICSAIPIGTALAQSWNTGLCEACGDLVGREMERYRVHIWLAPALNIHRSPLCGRNFEYYSEDPLISGKMAAAVTRGVQKYPGRAVSLKHFACNNQETNRFRSNSLVSRRALRDIYLKGFEIAVKQSDPATIMSSYNLLNGEHTSQRYDLLETILREEWGFRGIVMSDWVTGGLPSAKKKYPIACASGGIKAGNDIMMPGTKRDQQDLMNALSNADTEYPITRENLERCAARLLHLVMCFDSSANKEYRSIGGHYE